jgi:two-component system NtrC family sensor kinase
MTTITIFIYKDQRQQAINQARRNVSSLANSIEGMLRVAMFVNDRSAIDRMIQEVAGDHPDDEISLFDHAGEIHYSSDPKNVGQRFGQNQRGCNYCHDQSPPKSLLLVQSETQFSSTDQMVHVSLPIYNASECWTADCHAHPQNKAVLGMIEMDVSIAPVFTSLVKARNRLILLSFCLAALASLVVWILIQRWVNRPVHDLVTATKLLAEGNRSDEIPLGEGELGLLAHSFNAMSKKLDASRHQLILSEKLASAGRLAAGVAHELNNPLTGILSYAEDLVEDADKDDPLLKDYELIHRETLRCRQIVRHLLDFARQDKPQVQSVDINEVIKNTLQLINRISKFQNVKITTALPDLLPPISADPGQIEQVILNLLLNAANAMPEGGVITLETKVNPDKSEVVATVTDTGSGIPPENISKIFEPFYSSKKKKTTGLGLAVCLTIIENHGGRIEVESVVGAGTAFTVSLPIEI